MLRSVLLTVMVLLLGSVAFTENTTPDTPANTSRKVTYQYKLELHPLYDPNTKGKDINREFLALVNRNGQAGWRYVPEANSGGLLMFERVRLEVEQGVKNNGVEPKKKSPANQRRGNERG